MPRHIMSEELFCVALFSEDNYFYRCQIKKICDLTNTLKVLYIDYGNEGWVNADEVKFLVSQFGQLPIQAVNARIAHIIPSLGNSETGLMQSCLNSLFEKIQDEDIVKINFFADIVGFYDGAVCLDIFKYSHRDPSRKKSLSTKIVECKLGRVSQNIEVS